MICENLPCPESDRSAAADILISNMFSCLDRRMEMGFSYSSIADLDSQVSDFIWQWAHFFCHVSVFDHIPDIQVDSCKWVRSRSRIEVSIGIDDVLLPGAAVIAQSQQISDRWKSMLDALLFPSFMPTPSGRSLRHRTTQIERLKAIAQLAGFDSSEYRPANIIDLCFCHHAEGVPLERLLSAIYSAIAKKRSPIVVEQILTCTDIAEGSVIAQIASL